VGLLFSYAGVMINQETREFLKDFGLILFVYSIGLQVGPGFFASLKKNALVSNALAASVVIGGIITTILLFYLSHYHISIMTGVMSGAVTNTPGLGAAQSTAKDLHISSDASLITLAYAVAYPFGVFGIIASLVILKKVFKTNILKERELHRRLALFRSNKPISIHLSLDNQQFVGHPLRHLFALLKEPIVVSRMYHNGEIITPTPDTVMAENDIMLIVASKRQAEELKLLIGSQSNMNLKNGLGSDLILRQVVVTRLEVTHKRLGNIPEIHQHNFTITRLNRAGIEVVAHGDIFLQLGDVVTVVGTAEGVKLVARALGNSLKKLEVPELAPIFMGIVLGVILGSLPIHFPNMPVPVKIGLAGGPLIVALLLSRFGSIFYLNNYTTNSANLMIRELGIALFLASVGLSSGHNLANAFASGSGWVWIAMAVTITVVPLLITGFVAHKYFRKTFFEVCGLLAGASTDPPALAFATKLAGNDIPSITYATVYPLTMIMRIVAAQLLILLFA
jgi:putative transport protein